ncbi:hypothetical protein [Micavibrio aeruginosavorus]|uniref:Uncharacterized protein n=1 Tax=Micavibrio aeruginosavorus EPB TaxID=349215 RepID=M4VH93_9BACT|nr:hypothetical protein [Micavibrio aeruginosavorus]AGH98563.1 hypothetical protein A11S_1761 [Micavibrio aeruginosavorus EPB]
MGSFASRPKTPSVQYVPVYTPTPTTTPSTGTGTDTGTTTPTDDETRSAQRAASLLERGRGRLSTITTGFRGLLSQGDTPQRKTLLGE